MNSKRQLIKRLEETTGKLPWKKIFPQNELPGWMAILGTSKTTFYKSLLPVSGSKGDISRRKQRKARKARKNS